MVPSLNRLLRVCVRLCCEQGPSSKVTDFLGTLVLMTVRLAHLEANSMGMFGEWLCNCVVSLRLLTLGTMMLANIVLTLVLLVVSARVLVVSFIVSM